MNVFILPTQGSTAYRGKFPHRARSIGRGATGTHVELNNGTRLWSAKPSGLLAAASLSDKPDFSATLDSAVQMTADQYAALREAAALLATRAQIAGHGRRAELETRVRAMVDSIKADSAQYAKRNAETARRETLASLDGFRAERPYRVRNRTPQFSGSFDFATLDEARDYLAAQLARRDSVVSGAAPVGPDSNSQDPLQSFIFWADGTETLADWGWLPPVDGGRRWTLPVRGGTVAPEREAAARLERPLIESGDALPPAFADSLSVDALAATADGKAAARPLDELGELGTADEAATRLERPLRLSASGPRRDNVEYHAGKAARLAGEPESACPYLPALASPDCRAARWTLGWREAKPETISLEMNWKAAAGIIRAALENGTGEGKRAARVELDRMAALADDRNALARALQRLAASVSETRHCVPGMAGEELETANAAAYQALGITTGDSAQTEESN